MENTTTKVKLNVKSQNTVVTETRNEACLDHGFLLLKSGVLPEKKKPVGFTVQDFPSGATRQQGAPLLHHKKYFDFFSVAKSSKNVAPK